MRKLVATALLALLLIGCESAIRGEAVYEGQPTSYWVETLKDNEDVNQRRAAAFVLGELGLTEADQTVPALGNALDHDEDDTVKLYALQSLQKLAPKARPAQAAVGRALNSKRKDVVRQALKTYRAIELARPSAINPNT